MRCFYFNIMGKITFKQISATRVEAILPAELIYYITNQPLHDGRYVRFGYHYIPDTNTFEFIIRNSYYERGGDYPTSPVNNLMRKYYLGKSRPQLKKNPTIILNNVVISSLVTLDNNRDIICSKYKVDYQIFEGPKDTYAIICRFKVNNKISIPSANKSSFHYKINDLFAISYNDQTKINKMINDSDEFYHYVAYDDSKSEFKYVTKEKFNHFVIKSHKNGIQFNQYNSLNEDMFTGITRTISLTKFMNRTLPDFDDKKIQAHLEYNKMLCEYNPDRFKIVTGDDIVKYYDQDNYFKTTGDLGTSCMRYENTLYRIEFYAKNSNVSLLIFTPEGVDCVMGRALIWTTVDGEKVMDRIYTCNSVMVSLFHKYAKENNITNVYEIRQYGSGNRNLTTMSPGHWSSNYDRNLIVNLDYIPKKLEKSSVYKKFNTAYFSRRLSTSDDMDFPYMDNFNLVNAVSMQVSVLPIQGTFICPLSNQPIDMNNYHSDNGVIYNAEFVDFDNNGPYLLNDEVTLNASEEQETIDF